MERRGKAPRGFRPVPRTGVIYVDTEARARGYRTDSASWANLGQGAPETNDLPEAPPRVARIDLQPDDCEYAPVDGLPELRDAVAHLYNTRYRQGKKSLYTRDNVAICAGGRLALSRLVTTLAPAHVGHFLPDYTAYEELLESFGTFVAIPIPLDPERGYEFGARELEREIRGRGLSAVLLSNPSNPTGRLVRGVGLDAWVDRCRNLGCTLILDEFYAHYTYAEGVGNHSVARHVEHVDEDPVIILDGLTKNWRYPGWRVAWTVGPRAVIEPLASAGSFMDGGCPRPMQRAAVPLLEPTHADREATAIRHAFSAKRRLLIDGLRDLGIAVDPEPEGGFYCWGDVGALPASLDTGRKFFERSLDAEVIVVPGHFFDINPGHRRADRPSRFRRHVRFSFGAPRPTIERGLAALRRLLDHS